VIDATGKVRVSRADKHRQLERYLEIIAHLVRACGWTPNSTVELVDMGCGKGYLTFGVWHLLNHRLGLRANVLGIDARSDLVAKSNAVAQRLGAATLRFVQGDIASVALARIDGLIALHACNTATDHAIVRGVRAGAKLIVVSPCCHQELRPLLGRPGVLAPLLQHGILAERLSEWLTDGLRLLRLEQAGYDTRVIEFVASEHTPRNLLIAGVRRDDFHDAPVHGRQAAALKDFFHLGDLASDEIARS
jgi:SAM-dependent methyltransferase